jgi:hypothetical protein
MRKRKLGWLFWIACFGSCNQAAKAPTIIEDGDGYISTEYNKNGSVYSQKHLIKDVRDSMIAHGVYIAYHPNGNVLSRQYYHLGNVVGQIDSFYVDGKSKSSSLYNQRNELVGQVLYDTNGDFLNFYKDPFHILRDKGYYVVGDSLRTIYEVLNVQNLHPQLNIVVQKDGVRQSITTIDHFDVVNNTLYGYYYTVFHSPGQYIHVVDFEMRVRGSNMYQRRILDTIYVSEKP